MLERKLFDLTFLSDEQLKARWENADENNGITHFYIDKNDIPVSREAIDREMARRLAKARFQSVREANRVRIQAARSGK